MNATVNKPYAMVGAGRLAASIWKSGNEADGWSYGFNVFRCEASTGEVSQRLEPDDIRSMAKLARVLAQVIADDGCVSSEQRNDLHCLATDLELLWDIQE